MQVLWPPPLLRRRRSTKVRSFPFLVQQLIIKQTNETLSRLSGIISKIFQNISIPNNKIFIQHFRNSAVQSGVMLSELSIFTV